MSESHDKIDGDLLISRIVDGEASEGDWTTFRSVAEREPSLWRELAEYQRDQAELSTIVSAAIRVADGVEAPVQEEMGRRFSDRTRLVSTWGGWAAAAALVLAWTTGAWNNRTPAPIGNHSDLSGLSSLQPREVMDKYVSEGKLTPTDLYDLYLDSGKERGTVVGEIPDRVLVSARPMKAGGGYELTYIRQIMERVHVKELNRVAHDEFGNPIGVPIGIPTEVAPATVPDRY